MLEIKERKPVIYVPRLTKRQIAEYGWDRWGLIGTKREIIQEVLNRLLENDEHLWPSVELGLISSWNEAWVFVKYHPSLHQTGWDITAKATSMEDLFERRYVSEDRQFLDVPEYPDFDDHRNGYEAAADGNDPWYLIGDLMAELREDKREALEAALEMDGGMDELDRIAAMPMHEWINDLWVFSRDEDGVYARDVAEFNFHTWEWVRTPGVQEETC